MNYYELLNVARDADDSEIKRAYFTEVKAHSPDSDPEGFKALRIAYETLYNPKKRSEYDSYFDTSDGILDDMLAARELIRETKYLQAVEFLTELSGKNPDSADVKRLLAEVYWHLKKNGTAVKICGELLEKEPADHETLTLLANITVSQGHKNKANGYFDNAVRESPLNPKVWIAYMHYALSGAPQRVPGIFQRAMELDKNMFRDDYLLYLLGTHSKDLFSNENSMQYYDKFAEFFLNDKNPEEEVYLHMMRIIPKIIENEKFVPFVEKILPSLENSKQYSDEDEESFKYIRLNILLHKLHADKRIHDVLKDITMFFLLKEEDIDDRLSMEVYIVYHLSLIRPSIKLLKSDYPEFYKMNQEFYNDALNEKKNDYLIDKYIAVEKKLAHNKGIYFDSDKTEEIGTYTRETPKTGRNDPCPCGSGKKYKKCCGRN